MIDTPWRRCLWAVRAVFVFALLVGLVLPLSQLDGKAWPARVLGYPLAMLVLPVAWRLSVRRFTYSYLADTLLVAPFLLDALGNLAGLFDSVERFDDVLHFLNWSLLVAAFVVTVQGTTTLPRPFLLALGAGFGALAAVAWECQEYVIAQVGASGLHSTYGDTIGDLALSTTGGVVGALLVSRRRVRVGRLLERLA